MDWRSGGIEEMGSDKMGKVGAGGKINSLEWICYPESIFILIQKITFLLI